MKNSYRGWLVVGLGFTLAACGGAGNDSPTGGENTSGPTLGVSSIQKLAATALPNMGSSADAGSAAPCTAGAPLAFPISGGKVWVRQAYVILDEIEFQREPSTAADPEFGPFAVDLTHSDPQVGEAITMDVPAGNYKSVKYRIKRIEDDTLQPLKNVTNAAAFRQQLIGEPKRRPSIWIEGSIGVGSESQGYGSCKEFVFVADHRWELVIPLQQSTASAISVDTVVLFDLEAAFSMALASRNANAQMLAAEVGTGAQDNMGPLYLDGRTRDKDHGTPIATAITEALPEDVVVFAQATNAVRGFDDNPGGSSQVDSTAPIGTTIIDDSAARISGDDNPSISDLTE